MKFRLDHHLIKKGRNNDKKMISILFNHDCKKKYLFFTKFKIKNNTNILLFLTKPKTKSYRAARSICSQHQYTTPYQWKNASVILEGKCHSTNITKI